MALNEDKYDEIYRRYAPAVYRRARRLMGSESEAQDITHDVFLALFEHPQQFAGRSSLTTYLYSVTTYACLSRIRNAKSRARILAAHARTTAAHVHDPRHSELLDLHEALRLMPDDLARVAIYAHVDQLSHAEIAELVGCSRRHVANLLEKASRWGRPRRELSCC